METLKACLMNDRFASSTGVNLLEMREGYAKASLLVTERHLNAGGVCQGGVLFTLADLAFAAVANCRNQLTLSLNANITFLRPVREGWIYAEAHEIFNHAKVPFIEVRIYDEAEKLVAVFTSTGYRKPESVLK